jgi:hypothetical protein
MTPRARAREGWIEGKNGGWLKPIRRGQKTQAGYHKPNNYVTTLHLARKSSPDAMRTLIRLLCDPDGRIAAVAANSVLERARGRTKEMQPEEREAARLDLSALTDAELQLLLRLVQSDRFRPVPTDEPTDASDPPTIEAETTPDSTP